MIPRPKRHVFGQLEKEVLDSIIDLADDDASMESVEDLSIETSEEGMSAEDANIRDNAKSQRKKLKKSKRPQLAERRRVKI